MLSENRETNPLNFFKFLNFTNFRWFLKFVKFEFSNYISFPYGPTIYPPQFWAPLSTDLKPGIISLIITASYDFKNL